MLHIKKNINKLCFLLAFVVCGCGGHANTHADNDVSLINKEYIIRNVYGPFYYDNEAELEVLLSEYLSGKSYEDYRFPGVMISMFSINENKYKYEYLLSFNLGFFDQFDSTPNPYIIVDFDDMRKCYMIISLAEDGLIIQSTADNNSVSVNTHITQGKSARYEFDITILNNPCI